jgi:hypothetical protein
MGVPNVELMQLGEERPVIQEEKPKTLYLRFNTMAEDLKNEVVDILKGYKGKSDVVIKCSVTNQIFKLNLKVNLDSFIIQELKSVIGEDNIKER